jgi:hypothetical protein
LEASERIGAARYERTDTRVTDRNGVRPRLLSTQAGDVQLRIPKLAMCGVKWWVWACVIARRAYASRR